ncbi:hypothetical protein JCM3774_000552 [Rhodotorula dairenensis]
MLSPTTRSNYARRHRVHALGLALAAVVWHVWLSVYLSGVARGLAGDAAAADDVFAGRDGDDARDWEGAERRRIEGVRALLGIARLWSWCSVGVALGGLFGILTDHLALIRLFMLNGFLSLSLDLVLLSTIFLILTVANPASASGSSGLATTVCQALSSSVSGATSFPVPFSGGLPDLLGLSLEACEEQFEGVLVSALGALAVVEGARAWLAIRILGYYAMLVRSRMSSSTRRARGGDEFYDSPVELEGAATQGSSFRTPSRSSSSTSTLTPQHASSSTSLAGHSTGKKKRRESHGESGSHASASSSSNSDRRKQRERERSGSLRSASGSAGDKKRGGDETRIFLLPRSEDRGVKGAAGESAASHRSSMSQTEQGVPLLTLTTSSPISATFPPMRHHADGGPPRGGREYDAARRVLVYAPVFVSPEEARSLGATEVVLGSNSPSTHHSHHHHHQHLPAHSRRRGNSHPPAPTSLCSPPLHASSSLRHHHHHQHISSSAAGMQEPMTPVRSRSSTITPGSSTSPSTSNSNSGETTPRLGSAAPLAGGGSGSNRTLSPAKPSSPLRPVPSLGSSSSGTMSRTGQSLKIDPELSHQLAEVSTCSRGGAGDDANKTPVASLSGQNLALGLDGVVGVEDKGNKLA